MIWKWIGASLIIAGCGGTGISIAVRMYQEEHSLKQFSDVLSFMENELQFRLTPLPELCHLAAKTTGGKIGETMEALSRELSRRTLPDPDSCMTAVLNNEKRYSRGMRMLFHQLAKGLGRFDLNGQIQALHCVRDRCQEELIRARTRSKESAKSYQTLGICAGGALVILFI